MRQWIARQMMRPWVYRIGCLVIFLFAMFWVREGLTALKDTGDRGLILGICIPGTVALITFGFWLQRRGY